MPERDTDTWYFFRLFFRSFSQDEVYYFSLIVSIGMSIVWSQWIGNKFIPFMHAQMFPDDALYPETMYKHVWQELLVYLVVTIMVGVLHALVVVAVAVVSKCCGRPISVDKEPLYGDRLGKATSARARQLNDARFGP